MKMTKKYKRLSLSILIVCSIGLLSNYLVRNTPIASFTVFDSTNLFTYFGVLIGFALTIYTFGLSMISDIKKNIENSNKFDDTQKANMYNSLVSGFSQIKRDIWLIFYSILLIILFAILKHIPNPFDWEVLSYKIPETVNLTLFISTTIAMWDIMQTLFNLSEINFELNKK